MIEKELLSKRTSNQANRIVDLVLKNPQELKKLMSYFQSEDNRICQTASWSVGILAAKAPELLIPYLKDMIDIHEDPPHDSVVRNSIRAWQFMEIPEEYEGQIFDLCFNYISDISYPIAIRAFSMTVCFNIGKRYPDILEELKAKLELINESDSPGIRSRTRNILKAIHKIL